MCIVCCYVAQLRVYLRPLAIFLNSSLPYFLRNLLDPWGSSFIYLPNRGITAVAHGLSFFFFFFTGVLGIQTQAPFFCFPWKTKTPTSCLVSWSIAPPRPSHALRLSTLSFTFSRMLLKWRMSRFLWHSELRPCCCDHFTAESHPTVWMLTVCLPIYLLKDWGLISNLHLLWRKPLQKATY